MSVRILVGDVRARLAELPDQSVQCVVTSPPYYNLRDYGVVGQIGLESTLAEYLEVMVDVFRGVRRVLRDDGVLWLNMGDSYAAGGNGTRDSERWPKQSRNNGGGRIQHSKKNPGMGVKPKDLLMVPARLAIALQDDGWFVRMDCIWEKPNAMPESVKDRPTKSHEYIYLLTKSARYFYDAASVKVPASKNTHSRGRGLGPKTIKVPSGWETKPGAHGTIHREGRERTPTYKVKQNESFALATLGILETRNLRSVWRIPTHPMPEAHFATFPPALVEICIKAGSRPGDTVLDPFGGAGTTGLKAEELGRDSVLIELNREYAEIARNRIYGSILVESTIPPALPRVARLVDLPLFAEVEVA